MGATAGELVLAAAGLGRGDARLLRGEGLRDVGGAGPPKFNASSLQQTNRSRCEMRQGTYVLDPWLSVLCMRSKAWLAARVSLRLARLSRIATIC